MDDMYVFYNSGKYLEGNNDMYQHNYSRPPTLDEAEWEDGAKNANIQKIVIFI